MQHTLHYNNTAAGAAAATATTTTNNNNYMGPIVLNSLFLLFQYNGRQTSASCHRRSKFDCVIERVV